jgi:hypothetical protein
LARYCEGNEYFPHYPYFFIRAERGDAERPLIFKLGKPGAEMLVDLFNQSQSPLWVARCHGFLLVRAGRAFGLAAAGTGLTSGHSSSSAIPSPIFW